MKKLFFLICVVGFAFSVSAQNAGLSITGKSKFYLDIQNQPVNDDTVNSVYLLGLPSNVTVTLKIYTGGIFYTLNQQLVLQAGQVMYYDILTRPGLQPVLRFIRYGNVPVFSGTPAPSPNGYPRNAVDPASFQLLLEKIKAEPFDQKRVEMANQAAENSAMTSAQVREIAKVFDFDKYRLEFAEHAWHYVYDKGMYLLVYDAFQFANYVNQLKEYMKENP